MPKQRSFFIITCDGNQYTWPFKLAKKVPEFYRIIDDYEEKQQSQDSDDEYDLPAQEIAITSNQLDQVQTFLENEQALLFYLPQQNYDDLTALWHAAVYLDLNKLSERILPIVKNREQQQQEKTFYILLVGALNEILKSAPKPLLVNIRAQTKGSYEDRQEAINDLKDMLYMKERDISCAKFARAYFDSVIQLALCRVIYIIECKGAKSNVKSDFDLSIDKVFECLVCALRNAEYVGRSRDNGVDGLFDQAVIQCKAGASHRDSAKRIWRELLGTCLIHKSSTGVLAVTDSTWKEEPPKMYEEESNKSLEGSALASIRLELYSQRNIIYDLTHHSNPPALCASFLSKLPLKDKTMKEVRDKLMKTLKLCDEIDKIITEHEQNTEDIHVAIETTKNSIDDDIPVLEAAFYEGWNQEPSSEEEEEEEEEEEDEDED